MRRTLVTVVALLGVTACGSTVQVARTAPASDGLAPAQQLGPAAGPTTQADAQTALPGQQLPAPVRVGGGPARVTSGRPLTSTSTASGSAVPGVTATSITVGVLAQDPQANTTLENAGYGAASTGDEPANWRAMADEVNEHGGVAGRKLQLVIHLINLTDPPATQGQQACTDFTQDNEVAVVLSTFYYAPAHECLAAKGMPSVAGTNFGVDRVGARQVRTVASWATPLLDRLSHAMPDAFQRMGQLKPGTKAGILTVDTPAYRRSADVLARALRSAGVSVTVQQIRDSNTGDYGGDASDASSAVLRFQSAGVTQVMFLSRNAFEPTLFMQAANSQQFFPTYLLTTQQYPAGLTGLVPPGQLKGALAAGWAPAIDLSTGYAESPRAKECLRELRSHGRTYSTSTQVLVGLLACDGVDLLQRAAALPAALADRTALLRAVLDPDTGFVSAVTAASRFEGGRPDGVAAYRPAAFGVDCTCFRYTGGTVALP